MKRFFLVLLAVSLFFQAGAEEDGIYCRAQCLYNSDFLFTKFVCLGACTFAPENSGCADYCEMAYRLQVQACGQRCPDPVY